MITDLVTLLFRRRKTLARDFFQPFYLPYTANTAIYNFTLYCTNYFIPLYCREITNSF